MTALILALTDPVPQDKDVTAGWIGALVFVALILAVVLLGFSLVKQLRKAQNAADAGVYGDEPKDPAGPADVDDPS